MIWGVYVERILLKIVDWARKNKGTAFLIVAVLISLLVLGILNRSVSGGQNKKVAKKGGESANSLRSEPMVSPQSPLGDILDQLDFQSIKDRQELLSLRSLMRKRNSAPFPIPDLVASTPPSLTLSPPNVSDLKCEGGIMSQEAMASWRILSPPEEVPDGVKGLLDNIINFYLAIYREKWGFQVTTHRVDDEEEFVQLEGDEKGSAGFGYYRRFDFPEGQKGATVGGSVSVTVEKTKTLDPHGAPCDAYDVRIRISFVDFDDT